MHCWQDKPPWFILRRSRGAIQWGEKCSLYCTICIWLSVSVCLFHPLFSPPSHYLFPLSHPSLSLSPFNPLSLSFCAKTQPLPFSLILCQSELRSLLEMYWNALTMLYILPPTWLFMATLIHLWEAQTFVWKCALQQNGLNRITPVQEKLFFQSCNIVLFNAAGWLNTIACNPSVAQVLKTRDFIEWGEHIQVSINPALVDWWGHVAPSTGERMKYDPGRPVGVTD